MNRKLSLEGQLFLKQVKPFITAFGWLTFIMANIFVIMHSYSYLKGLLIVGGVQLSYGLVYIVGMYLFLSWKDKKREKEETIKVS